MPELPEVETIKGQLNKKIRDKKIKTMEINLAKMLVGVTVDKFKKIVEGRKIKSVERRAKLLIINLSNNYSLVIHLKMTGQLLFFKNIKDWEAYKNEAPRSLLRGIKRNPPKPPALPSPPAGGFGGFSAPPFPQRTAEHSATEDKSAAHLIYYFENGNLLVHNDTRQFGYVKLIKTADLESLFRKESFGPEPLAKDFTLKKFKNLLVQKPRAKIKPLLMDQTFLAGIGNIYSQEACFAAKIFPTRSVQGLTQQEIRALYLNLIKILCQAVSARGSSVDNYLDTGGQPGEYAPRLKVYNREGEKCYRCDGTIKKMTLAGRGTYYCPKCQI